MTIAEATVRLSIPAQGMSLEELETRIGQLVKQAANDLLRQACQHMDAERVQNEPGVRAVKQRSLHLLTRFGWTSLVRWQVRDAQGHYRCPLDQMLGLGAAQHTSPWITDRAVGLATRLPFRQAACLLGTFVDEAIDHRSLHRWIQKAGAQVVMAEDALQQAVFANGALPPQDDRQRELILTEVDGTFLRAQREDGPKFEVRLGVLTTGKSLVSPTARNRRYRLQERIRYAGVETAQDFGERLFLKGEAHLGLSRAQHLLLVGDGADWIEALAGHDRWRATYQLDRWHLTHAFHRTFPDHPQLVEKLKRALYRGQGKKIIPTVRLAKINGVGDPEQVESLLGYLKANQAGFYGARSLWPRLSPEGRLVCVEGSGAVEKHIDLTICRRFKGWGMRWTRKGANRLLKLRIRELDRVA
jgi:hypothetical protein